MPYLNSECSCLLISCNMDFMRAIHGYTSTCATKLGMSKFFQSITGIGNQLPNKNLKEETVTILLL